MDGMEVSDSLWDHKSMLLFLEECRKNKADLKNPKLKQRSAFLQIHQAMEAKDYFFSVSSLDKKLQNMKTHFLEILDSNKKSSTGRGLMTWPYFELMSSIYEEEVRLQDCPTIDSIAPESQGTCRPTFLSISSSSSSSTPSSQSPVLSTPSSSRGRVNKSERARRDAFEFETKKLKVAEDILEEVRQIKRLKERQIEMEEKRLALEERRFNEGR